MTTPETADHPDMLAGEYVLGTLDHAERTQASLRRVSDPVFDGAVTAWEHRLAPLYEAAPEVEPPSELWSSILARIMGLSAAGIGAAGNVVLLSRQLQRWKQVAVASMALAAALALWVAVSPFMGTRGMNEPLVAVLQKTNDAPAFVMRADLRDNALSINPVAATPIQGKSYELWIIDADLGAPKSLGILGEDHVSQTKLPNVSRAVLERATYAVTIEPPGGSVNGVPSGAPVFFGHLLRTGP
ncbi:anti-sigma factor [Lichenihabitans sp. PAMC28606]|uniref:anti-sigma factor n=1 Tax=Lichenihabitans sp. PAMC28606 TaxID=2880932 RepID=UPI001D0BE05C|nr:anti-sigma factor [Lichenihabitans sp. PAMC28606]UDL95127.1 anti-sigma factor [Lichenihabitans sp. PAMC28606]